VNSTAIDGGDPSSSLVAGGRRPPSVNSARSKKSPVDKLIPIQDQDIAAADPPPLLASARASSIVGTRPSFADASRKLSTLTGSPEDADVGTTGRSRSSSIEGGPLSQEYMDSVAAAYLSSKTPQVGHISGVTDRNTPLSIPRLSQAIASKETNVNLSSQRKAIASQDSKRKESNSNNGDSIVSEDEKNEEDGNEGNDGDGSTHNQPKGPEKKNFHEQEDIILSMAWVNHSTNSITGTDQDSKEFWESIFKNFEKAYNDYKMGTKFNL
jgi:hypothetical protein